MALRFGHLAYGAAALLPLAVATDAAASDTTTVAIAAGNFGTLAAPLTYAGTVTVAASGGAISISPAGAAHVGGADVFTVTVTCTGSSNQCNSGAVSVTISNVGSPTGRLGSTKNFHAAAGTGTLTPATPGPGNPLTFTLGAVGKGSAGKTFTVGFDTPLNATGSSGAASTAFQVTAQASGTTSGAATSTINANVYPPIAVANTSAMQFGTIVKPASGSGAVTLTNAGVLSTTAGSIVPTSTHGAAGFSVTGGASASFTLTVPSTFVMSTGTHSLTVTTNSSATGTLTLAGGGSTAFTVGGSFPISTSTSSGAYTGSLVVTVAYN